MTELTFDECQVISDLWHGESVDEAKLPPILAKLKLRDRRALRLWASPVTSRTLDQLGVTGAWTAPKVPAARSSFEHQVMRFKLDLIASAIEECDGSKVKAAELLQMPRGSLHKVLRRGRVTSNTR